MIIISPDVTNHTTPPFAVADHKITNLNGSISYVNADGTVVGQEPMQYGVRHDASNVDSIGVYQMFTERGALTSIQTRPQDPAYVYTTMEAQAFL